MISRRKLLRRFWEEEMDDVDMEADDISPPDQVDTEDPDEYMDHLGKLASSIICDTDLSTDQKREKINALLDMMAKGEDTEEEDDEDLDDETPDKQESRGRRRRSTRAGRLLAEQLGLRAPATSDPAKQLAWFRG